MEISRVHAAGRPAWPLVATVGMTLVFTAAADAGRGQPTMRDARDAARAAVVEHPSYRIIRSHERLVTRSCWRARRAVRCSLYRWAPNPCALDGTDGICAQVMTRRTWMVTIRRRDGRTIARITRIADTSVAIQSASARSSS